MNEEMDVVAIFMGKNSDELSQLPPGTLTRPSGKREKVLKLSEDMWPGELLYIRHSPSCNVPPQYVFSDPQ